VNFIEIIEKSEKIILNFADEFNVNPSCKDDLVESFVDIKSSLHEDLKELNGYLDGLDRSIEHKEKQPALEAICMARAMIMGIETNLSNLSESLEKSILDIRDKA